MFTGRLFVSTPVVLCFECGKVGGDVGEEFVPDTVVVPLQFTLVLLLITGDQRFILVEGITTFFEEVLEAETEFISVADILGLVFWAVF